MSSFRQTHYVAVYPDSAGADRAVGSLLEAGFDERQIRVGAPDDVTASLRAEQGAELGVTTVGPAIGAYTKEMTKGAALLTLAGAVVGALIALPFAFIEFADLDLWIRILILVAAGGLAGSAAGFVIGGSLGARGPGDPAAADAGVTVAVATDDRRALRSLEAHHPIRVDLVTGAGSPVEAVDSEDQHRPDGIVQELRDNVERDDYRRHEPGRPPG